MKPPVRSIMSPSGNCLAPLEITKGRTVISIAHRLSTLAHCHRVVDLSDSENEGSKRSHADNSSPNYINIAENLLVSAPQRAVA